MKISWFILSLFTTMLFGVGGATQNLTDPYNPLYQELLLPNGEKRAAFEENVCRIFGSSSLPNKFRGQFYSVPTSWQVATADEVFRGASRVFGASHNGQARRYNRENKITLKLKVDWGYPHRFAYFANFISEDKKVLLQYHLLGDLCWKFEKPAKDVWSTFTDELFDIAVANKDL